MGRERNVARMGEMMSAYKVLTENLKVRDHSEDLGVDEKIISERILGKLDRKV
jgi:hypothetical protein